jgi:hypothetical protein
VETNSLLAGTIPSVTLTATELDEAEQRIEKGELPPDWFAQYYKAVDENVFGVDFKKDRDGRPIETGIGSPSNQTQTSIDAYKKYGQSEPSYLRNLAQMEKDLAACEQRRAADRAAAGPNKYGRR